MKDEFSPPADRSDFPWWPMGIILGFWLPVFLSGQRYFYLGLNFYSFCLFLSLGLACRYSYKFRYLPFYLLTFFVSFPLGAKALVVPWYKLTFTMNLAYSLGLKRIAWEAFAYDFNSILPLFCGGLALNNLLRKNNFRTKRFFIPALLILLGSLGLAVYQSWSLLLDNYVIHSIIAWVTFMVFIISAPSYSDEKFWPAFWNFIVFCGLLVSVWAIFQHYFMGGGLADPFLTNRQYTRSTVFFSHPNILATYLGLVLTVALGRFLLAAPGRQLYQGINVFVISWGVQTAVSRGAFLALVPVVLLAILISKKYSVSNRKIFLVFLILIFSLLPLICSQTFVKRFAGISPAGIRREFSDFSPLPDNPNYDLAQRLVTWKRAAGVIGQNPLWGSGLFMGKIRHAHNFYLQTWLSLGAAGVFSFLALIILSFRRALKAFSATTSVVIRSVSLIAVLGGLFLALRGLSDLIYLEALWGLILGGCWPKGEL